MVNLLEPDVTIKILHRHAGLKTEKIALRVKDIMKIAGARGDEVSVVFVDDIQMSEYNKSFIGREGTTDVLSFSYDELNEEGKFNLGDIIISVETAEKQSEELEHPFLYEIDTLITHGILHLMGYDHTRDNGEMLKEQNRIMNSIYQERKNRIYEH